MKTNTIYYLSSPRGVSAHSRVQSAISAANREDRRVAAQTGGRGGADGYIVAKDVNGLHFRGMVCGRKIIGRTLGCGPSIVAKVQASCEK